MQLGKAGRNVGAVLIVEQIVDPVDRGLQLHDTSIEIVDKLLGLGRKVVDLGGKVVKSNVRDGGEIRTRRRAGPWESRL